MFYEFNAIYAFEPRKIDSKMHQWEFREYGFIFMETDCEGF